MEKLVDQYNNTYYHSFKVNDRMGITIITVQRYKNIFSKCYTENSELFIIDSVLKTNPWTYAVKKNNCCRVHYKLVIIQNQTVLSEIKLK